MALTLLPNLIAALVVAGLAVTVSLRRPSAPLWPILLIYQLCVLLYLAGDAITLVSQTMLTEQLGIAVLYTGSFPAAAVCWWLALRYAEAEGARFEWARGPWVWVPGVLVALGWTVMITNPWHGQFVTPVIGAHNEHHALWYAFVPASYAMVSATVLLYVGLALRVSNPDSRRNALTMAVGLLITFAINFVSYVPANGPPVDLTAFGLGLASAIFLYGAYRTRLFNLVPMALRQVIYHAEDGIVVVDVEGRRLLSNPAANDLAAIRMDAPDQDVLERLAACLRTPDGKHFPRAVLERELLGQSPRPNRLHTERETQISVAGYKRTPPGELLRLVRVCPVRVRGPRWLCVTSTPIPGRHGRPIAFSICLHDVTAIRDATARLEAAEERRRLDERAEQAKRLEGLGVLASGIAHDFNNLISVVVGNARLSLEAQDLPDWVRLRLERIERAGDLAAELTDQMLTTAGKHALRLERLDLSRLVLDMLDPMRAAVSPKCQIESDLAPDLPAVRGDATQLRMVVSNLVRNAAEAVGDTGGTISVSVKQVDLDATILDKARGASSMRPGPTLCLEVADDGRGMDEATRDRMFDPFFSTRLMGRGLGLSAVHGIAASHGAVVAVDSEAHVGSCFWVFFPIDGAEPIAAEPSPVELPMDLRGHGETTDAEAVHAATAVGKVPGEGSKAPAVILVVDDDDAVLELATNFLSRAGYVAIPCNSGTEALSIFEERGAKIDAAVLDLGMPGLDGEHTLRELQLRRPDFPVVLASGYGLEVAVEKFGVTAEASAFLQKPYEAEDLVSAVKKSLKRVS